MSAEPGEEWVYIDLCARFEFARLKLYWIAHAADGSVQVSDDAENWHDLMALPGEAGLVDDLKLAQPRRAATCECS